MNLSKTSVLAYGVFICLAVSSLAHDNNAGRFEDNSAENKDGRLLERKTREGLAEKGAEAVYHLLKGATFIRIQRGYRLYRKKGKYRDALRDFNAVNPHGVEQSRKAMLVGWVGDRKIRLVDNSRDNVGTVKGTVITVSQKGNELPLKLHYIR